MGAAGGQIPTSPDGNGAWKMRAFKFMPSRIIVSEGDDLHLHFVGVQGGSHDIIVKGLGVEERFPLARGGVGSSDLHASVGQEHEMDRQ